jgi:hypothetical protein
MASEQFQNWPPQRVWVPAGKFVGDYGYWTFVGQDDPELVTVIEATEEVGVPINFGDDQ